MTGPLKALLVLGCNKSIWRKEAQLPFPPFPGLGIRVDVYDMLHVDSVVVGDRATTSPAFAPSRATGPSTPRRAPGRSGSRRAGIRSRLASVVAPNQALQRKAGMNRF